jgi:broad specificity phosphatase PhoE
MLTYAEVAERVRAGEREFMSGFEEEEERVTVVLVGSGAIARACCYSLVRP